tara:strand:+ start:117 stop:341 length:225 start_codon:yes stop_codon:yes gene_type:complete
MNMKKLTINIEESPNGFFYDYDMSDGDNMMSYSMTKQQMKGNLLKMLSDDEGREIKMSDIVIRFNGRFINLKNL